MLTVATPPVQSAAGTAAVFGAEGDLSPMWSLSGHTGPMKFIVCGRCWIATSGGCDTLLWSDKSETFRNVERLTLSAPATDMTLNASESSVLHSFASGRALVFDVATAAQVAAVRLGDTVTNAIAAHPTNPDVFAAASDDGKVRLCDLRAFKPVCRTAAFADPATAVAFLPNGDVLAAGTDGVLTRSLAATMKSILQEDVAQDVVSRILVNDDHLDTVDVVSLDGLAASVDVSPVSVSTSRLSNFREGPSIPSRQLYQACRTRGALAMPCGDVVQIIGDAGTLAQDTGRHPGTSVTCVAYYAPRSCLVSGAEDGTVTIG